MALSTEAAVSEAQVIPRRRQQPRIALRSLAYVKLDEGNGGIIRDLTESGIAIQAVAPLRPGQEVTLHFDLLSPRVRIEARGRVSWSDSTGQGGVQFCGLTPRMRHALRDWMLTQMLAAATVSGRSTIFAGIETHLTLSSAVRAPIQLDLPNASAVISWGIFSFSPQVFSIFVDTLVLTCAVLLFLVSSLVIMGGFPAWPLATALVFASTSIFIAAYKLLFSDLLWGATPGRRLAALAVRPDADRPIPRFR